MIDRSQLRLRNETVIDDGGARFYVQLKVPVYKGRMNVPIQKIILLNVILCLWYDSSQSNQITIFSLPTTFPLSKHNSTCNPKLYPEDDARTKLRIRVSESELVE